MKVCKEPIAIVSVEWDVVDLIESMDSYEVIGFFDAHQQCTTREFRHLGGDEAWPKMLQEMPDLRIALALDHPATRARLFDHYGEGAIVSLQSPHAYVSGRASVGPGSIVQRGVTVMPYAQLDKGCKLNVNCSVHHEAQIGPFSTLAPGSTVLGNAKLGAQVYLGAGAVVRQRCSIGEGAMIGAGAVVVEDIPAGATVVGVPANRRLR